MKNHNPPCVCNLCSLEKAIIRSDSPYELYNLLPRIDKVVAIYKNKWELRAYFKELWSKTHKQVK